MKAGMCYWLMVFLISGHLAAQQVRVIPEPASVIDNGGELLIHSSIHILYSADVDLADLAGIFGEQVKLLYGINVSINPGTVSNSSINIELVVKQGESVNAEGYILTVNPQKVVIIASHNAGIFYGLQTLLQLFPPSIDNGKKNKGIQVPCVIIEDAPQYSYRGMHLDVSRHFFHVSFVKKFIDILAAYKINTFHWHLTDSHGWRIEIKKYPLLTSIGAWRAERPGMPMTIAPVTQPDEFATYGGYYTQEEIRDIIRYAERRFITIIPEIEVPGHCTAALAAYPQYADINSPTPVQIPCGYPGDLKHNFCAGYDSTYIFLQEVLTEVMNLFPSKYIHIGGDEVRGEPWLNCPRCRKLMKEKGFATAKELQGYFTHRIDSFITLQGRNIIGWEEILKADIAAGSVGMAWHGKENAVEDIRRGYKVVMTPYRYTYFDFYQSDPQLEEDITYAQLFIDSVYAFTVAPSGLTDEEKKNILGAQACLWTENVETPERVEYMLLPRLLAFSEAVWTLPGKKSYKKFVHKTEWHFKKMDAQHINYAKSLYNVAVRPQYAFNDHKVTVKLSEQTGLYDIRYTTDGSDPSLSSGKYIAPLSITKTTRVKAALFNNMKMLGKISDDSFAIHKATGTTVHFYPEKNKEATAWAKKLADGVFGTIEPYDGRWFSFTDSSISIIIDLKKVQTVHSIWSRFMEDQVGNIFLPSEIQFSISVDGNNFTPVGNITNDKVPRHMLRHIDRFGKNEIDKPARFVRVKITNALLNKGQERNLVFIDEIKVE